MSDENRKTMTLDEYQNVYSKRLDTIGRVINANPEIMPEDENPAELAMSLQFVGESLGRSLENDIQEIERLKKELDTANKNLAFQKDMTQQYYLQLSSQNNTIKQMEHMGDMNQGGKEPPSWNEIAAMIAAT